MLQPANNFGMNQNVRPQLRLKHGFNKVQPIFLRRTSSALNTKFARRFKSNRAVKAQLK